MGSEMCIRDRLQKPALTRLKKYDAKALEKLTIHKPRVAFLLTAPFDENLKEFESVANDMAHMASFALVDDHKNTGLYPGKVGCVAPNASSLRFPGGDLRVSSSVFARLRSRRRDGAETCSRPRGRADDAPPTRDPHRRTGSRRTTRILFQNSARTISGGSA